METQIKVSGNARIICSDGRDLPPRADSRRYCRLVPASRFVVQLHDATTLHFDLRVQSGDVLRSWAVPKGPSLDPAVRRLAVPVEDHELSAGEFEGVHEGQRRGSGAVIIWDEGPAEVTRDDPGHLALRLHGSKLAGGFALTRTGERRWILVKTRDASALPGSDIVAERPASVRTGRTWEEVAAGWLDVRDLPVRCAETVDGLARIRVGTRGSAAMLRIFGEGATAVKSTARSRWK
jgi:DNA ligase D-like protein (predicted 3'-phosphoesterase)